MRRHVDSSVSAAPLPRERFTVEATQELIENTKTIQVTETAVVFSRTAFPSDVRDGKRGDQNAP